MSDISAHRRDATRIIVACLEADVRTPGGLLPWATNTPKSKRLDLLRGYINTLATQFEEDEENGTIQSSTSIS